jgi:SNF2 family DNA or RNA helicase
MGSGKTVISLQVALTLSPIEPTIIVVAKTLISSWQYEIEKFFGDTIKYTVLHRERVRNRATWTLPADVRIVITTSEFLSGIYRAHGVENHFVIQQPNEHIGYTNVYYPPQHPLLSSETVQFGVGTIYTRRWGCLIVDEAHGFCNILVTKCRCIASLCVRHRWLLSGTHFHEPRPENLLGYYVMLNHPENPGNLIQMMYHMRHPNFRGLRETLVIRDKAQEEQDAPPEYVIDRDVVQTPMTAEETIVYTMCRDILQTINEKMETTQNMERRRKYAAYLLAIITYLRQILINPFIVFGSVALDVCLMEDGSALSHMIMDKLREVGLSEWLESPRALYSSRCKAVLRELDATTAPRVLIFSAFRTSLKLIGELIREQGGWEVFELRSEMSIRQKKETLQAFEQCSKGVLLLTYRLGSEGLNLQHTNTVFLMDTLWNCTAANQAIARVARRGQTSPVIAVKTFISDAGIEKAVYEKHVNKIEISNELLDGPTTKQYNRMCVKDIIKMVLLEDTARLCTQTYAS